MQAARRVRDSRTLVLALKIHRARHCRDTDVDGEHCTYRMYVLRGETAVSFPCKLTMNRDASKLCNAH